MHKGKGEMKIKLTSARDKPDPAINSLSGRMTAEALNATQIGKYRCTQGHGFAAEDANHIADKIRFRSARIVGADNVHNGPDRIVNGVQIQSKYWKTAGKTVEAAFDSPDGMYRYGGQDLEVPKDQYEQALGLMGDRIAQGKVPGFSNPADVDKLVRRGSVTYKQAMNIARAGNLDSLIVDAETQTVTSLQVAGISFAITYARSIWSGRSQKEAVGDALKSSAAAGGATMLTGVVAAQLLRTRPATGVVKLLSRTPVGRLTARSPASRLFRANSLTSLISLAVTSSPDFYRVTCDRSISWKQFAKNMSVNGSGVVGGALGWKAGFVAGAVIGTALPIPLIGTGFGALAGGLVGALGGGMGGSTVTNKVVAGLFDDDAKRLLSILVEEIQTLVDEYMLADDEVEEISLAINGRTNPAWLRRMYKDTRSVTDSESIRQWIRGEFEPEFEALIRRRPNLVSPTVAHIEEAVLRINEMPAA